MADIGNCCYKSQLYLKSHGVLHAETIHKVPVVIINRITISSIEIIIHQTISNHKVIWINLLVLLSQ